MNDSELPESIARLRHLRPEPVNRDAILFAAGKASARASRYWKMATVVLVLSQIVTLTLFWAMPNEKTQPPVVNPPMAPAVVEPESPTLTDSSNYMILSHRHEWENMSPEPATPSSQVVEESATTRIRGFPID
jgi:hypothetical protein